MMKSSVREISVAKLNPEDFYWNGSQLVLGESGYVMYVPSFRDGSAITTEGNGRSKIIYFIQRTPHDDGFDERDGKVVLYRLN